jgi:protein SFI1
VEGEGNGKHQFVTEGGRSLIDAQLLPAITFDNHRLKRKAFTSILRAMDRARAMKEFGGPRDRRLLGEARHNRVGFPVRSLLMLTEDVLAVWRDKAQAKIIARAG